MLMMDIGQLNNFVKFQFAELFICQTHNSEKRVILLLKWIYKKEGRHQLEIELLPVK